MGRRMDVDYRGDRGGMVCPRCGSTDVVVSASATEKAAARHGFPYWVFIGWWWHAILWLFVTLPMLFYRLIHRNRNTQTVLTTHAVCQRCGNTWVVQKRKA